MMDGANKGKTRLQLWLAELLDSHRSGKKMEPDGSSTPEYVLQESDITTDHIECPDCGTQNIHFDRWIEETEEDEPLGRAFTCDDCGCTFHVMRDFN